MTFISLSWIWIKFSSAFDGLFAGNFLHNFHLFAAESATEEDKQLTISPVEVEAWRTNCSPKILQLTTGCRVTEQPQTFQKVVTNFHLQIVYSIWN